MSPLNMKLKRDLWRLRGQVLAIAMVIACGIATLVMALSTIEALQQTSKAYYQQYRFAHVFASVTRAPQRLAEDIKQISGVQSVQTRISRYATVDVSGFSEPVIGQIVSIPEAGQPGLNQLVMRTGQWISANREDQIILNEAFAEAHNLKPGDSISIIMNGRKRPFTVVGIALSPEFIYSIGPGSLVPDDKRFGVIWMGRQALESAFDLEDAFNDVALTLEHNTPPGSVLSRLDNLLEPYGGTTALLRADQISNWFVMNEIEQQKSIGTLLPGIFIAVAMFLTNMVLSRLIATERTEIGLLKAFGYSNQEVAWHYIKMIILISFFGIFIGSVLGSLFGRLNTELYAGFFRFPILIYRPSANNYLIGGAICLIAAIIAAVSAVRKAVALTPAEAMIPPAPASYTQSNLTKSGVLAWLDQPSRIALRQITRWPLRSFMTSTGVALSVALVIMSLQWSDSMQRLTRAYFFESQKQDIMVGLTEPAEIRTQFEFAQLPGVLSTEPVRFVAADFSAGPYEHRGVINGIPTDAALYPIYDDDEQKNLAVPENGLVIANRLAQKLKVHVGDVLQVSVREGRRPELNIPIVAVFEAHIGLPVFMNIASLNRLLKERPSLSGVNLLVDENKEQALLTILKDTPQVSAVMLKQTAYQSFNDIVTRNIMVFNTIFSALAIILALGVTYNSTRIALSERGRELATLRVLGFTRGEISYVLLGEVMMLVLLALPLGCWLGYWLVRSMSSSFDTEMFRIPVAIQPDTYGYSVLLIFFAAVISAAIVRSRVDQLDLIRVLKTRE